MAQYTKKQLWFDVERQYKTMRWSAERAADGCGLMQKDNIRQYFRITSIPIYGCGLMQKDNIRQSITLNAETFICCGLMQKDNIRQ